MTVATAPTATVPLLFELDEKTWTTFLDRAETWLNTLLTVQAHFRKLAESTTDKIEEPHIKAYLREIADKAAAHEKQAEELYRVIGRDPPKGRGVLGTVMAKGGELAADLVGWMGGAASPWGDLRQLLLANLDSLGAFSIAEQIGYSLGLPAMAESCFTIGHEKHTHQLLIMEYMLEMGPAAILYKAPI